MSRNGRSFTSELAPPPPCQKIPPGDSMSDLDHIAAWLAWYVASGCSPGTARLRRSHMTRLAMATSLLDATEDDLVAFMAAQTQLRAESRKSFQASVHSFYRWALQRGLMASDPSVGLRTVKAPQGVPHPIPERELREALIKADAEQTLMLRLGAYAGLRRAEIAGVHAHDVQGNVLIVLGKGDKVRRVPIHPVLRDALRDLTGWAFPSTARPGMHVTADYVADRLGKCLPDGWTAHSLRHRFATAAYNATKDLRAVQQLLGHARPETTARYTLVGDDAMTAAVMAVA